MLSRLAALFLAVSVLPCVAQEAVSLDQLLDDELFSLKRDCNVASLGPGFAQRVDINGDGREDVMLDFGAVDCDGSQRRFCSDSGCRQALFLQRPDGGFTGIWRMSAINIAFDQPTAQWPSFVAELDGAECNRTAAETCIVRYEIRNGQARQTADR